MFGQHALGCPVGRRNPGQGLRPLPCDSDQLAADKGQGQQGAAGDGQVLQGVRSSGGDPCACLPGVSSDARGTSEAARRSDSDGRGEPVEQGGWSVECEKTYRFPGGTVLRPDLIATRPDGEKVFIVDMQVVLGSSNLRDAHEAKVRKYDRVDLKSAVASQRGTEVGRVEVAAATLSWRGIWHGKSGESLRAMGVPLGVLNGVTTRVILGSYLNWWSFNTSTSNFRKRQRGGVG
ncbi:Hypothetical protein NTJ_00199 [Nesidiocoris tenuis]|nr:Hypothetical protein NTJ_00199 [Nesidiocoris tenuis]